MSTQIFSRRKSEHRRSERRLRPGSLECFESRIVPATTATGIQLTQMGDYVQATFANATGSTQTFAVAGYQYFGPNALDSNPPQVFYDSSTVVVPNGQTVSVKLQLPMCNSQVDAFIVDSTHPVITSFSGAHPEYGGYFTQGSTPGNYLAYGYYTNPNCNTPQSPTPMVYQPEVAGDTATIGFWQNKNGHAVINSLNGGPTSTALGNWLATNFSNIFGDLAGATNAQVYNAYVSAFQTTGNKTLAQVFDTALSIYTTDANLNSTADGQALAKSFGFNVSMGGSGYSLVNVGALGTSIGLANNQSYTLYQLVSAANQNASSLILAQGPSSSQVESLFDALNQAGDI